MEFVQYSRDNLAAGLMGARAGDAITVPQYNSIVAYLAASEDFLNEPGPSTMPGRLSPILPTVRYLGGTGVSRVPLAGAVSEPMDLRAITATANDTAVALRFLRAMFSESAAFLIRRLRDYHELVAVAGPAGQVRAPVGVYGDSAGMVALVGDAADAAVSAGLAGTRKVRIPRELADQIEQVRPALDAVVAATLIAGQYNDPARGLRDSGNPVAITAVLPLAQRLSATFRSESQAAMYWGFGLAAAALIGAYAFSRTMKPEPRALRSNYRRAA